MIKRWDGTSQVLFHVCFSADCLAPTPASYQEGFQLTEKPYKGRGIGIGKKGKYDLGIIVVGSLPF